MVAIKRTIAYSMVNHCPLRVYETVDDVVILDVIMVELTRGVVGVQDARSVVKMERGAVG